MKNHSPLIKLFQTSSQDFYMFDANKNYILSLDVEIYHLLDSILSTENENFSMAVAALLNSNEKFKAFYSKALRNGFFRLDRVMTIEHPMAKFLDVVLEHNIPSICLQVTQNCNLRCDYCPYTGNYYNNRSHENKRMDFALAKRGIEYLAKHSSDVKRVNIAFYGGEPLLEIGLIEECIAYANRLFAEKSHVFMITTNGTIMNEKIAKMLVENDIFVIISLVSLDGPESIHNRSRIFADGSGSFQMIMKNLQWLRQQEPAYFKTNVSFNTVLTGLDDFSCVDGFFDAEDIFQDSAISTTLFNDTYTKKAFTRSDTFWEALQYEQFKYYLNQLGRIDVSSVINSNAFTQLSKTAKMLAPSDHLPRQSHPSGPCIPGAFKLFLNAEGIFYPCERVNEKSDVSIIGNIDDGVDPEKCRLLLNIAKLTEKECKDCWAFFYCKMCFVRADEDGQLSSAKRLASCDLMRSSILEDFRDICVMKKHGYVFL